MLCIACINYNVYSLKFLFRVSYEGNNKELRSSMMNLNVDRTFDNFATKLVILVKESKLSTTRLNIMNLEKFYHSK